MAAVTPQNQRLEDLRPQSHRLVITQRPGSTSSTRTRTRTPSHRDTARSTSHSTLNSASSTSVRSVPDENLSAEEIEGLLSRRVRGKRDDLRAAFRALDVEGNSTVTKGEFRRVIEGFLLPLTQSQFDRLLATVPRKENGTIAYVEFLGRYCRISTAKSRYSSPGVHCRTLVDIQCCLKDKIGNNLKNLVRAFRLFDYNRDGRIQHHELRSVLESYCFSMSDREFHRLWSHYSPNNAETVSYLEFLEKLGIDCENHRKPKPYTAKLALNWDAVSQDEKRQRNETKTWAQAGDTTPFQELMLDEIQPVFLKKIRTNCADIRRALQAFDVTGTGFVSQEDLKSVLSNFLFPMSDITFLGLASRFGVRASEPVPWNLFLARFQEDTKKEVQTVPAREEQAQQLLEQSSGVLQKIQPHVREAYPLLKRAFRVFDEDEDGKITPAEMRKVVEGLTVPLTDQEFKELTNLLDPDHTGLLSYQHFQDLADPHKGPPVTESRWSGTPESRRINEGPADTHAWSAVEGLLRDKLSDQLHAVMVALEQRDHGRNGRVPHKELRKVIRSYGLPVSDSHFRRLCEPCMDSGGVNYRQFLRSLGVPGSSDEDTSRAPGLSERSLVNVVHVSDRKELSTGSHLGGIKSRAVEEVVLRILRERLAARGVAIRDCLRATGKNTDGMLLLRDFKRILDDCRIVLDEERFRILTESLGFEDGELRKADFLAKYDEKGQAAKPQHSLTNQTGEKPCGFATAEDCFSQMEARIKDVHGNVFSAFRVMDKNRDGIVNRQDFRALFDSLMFVTKEQEYQRLLELLGLKPGATLNYAEFSSKVQSRGRAGARTPNGHRSEAFLSQACDQVHGYLVTTARSGWREMAKAFSHLDQDGQRLVFKKDLKHLLYTYSLPITPNEFDQLWSRYDEAGRGHVTASEFLNKLGVDPEGDGRGPDHVTAEELSGTELKSPMDTAGSQTLQTRDALQEVREVIKGSFQDFSSIARLDKKKEAYVTVEELLAFLRKHGCHVEGAQLIQILNNMGISTADRRLPYVDFLRTFDPRAASRSSKYHSSPIQEESVEELSPERALLRVRETVTASAETLHKAFSAFDKNGAGTVRPPEFRQVLDHFCAGLSGRQFGHLLSKLAPTAADGGIDWRAFLHRFRLDNQETAEEWHERVKKVTRPTKAHPTTLNDILGRIHEVVSARLYTLTKEIVDLDFARIEVISKEDFRVICDRYFRRLTDDQFDNLWNVLPVNAFGNLEYRKFLKRFSGEPRDMSPSANAEAPERGHPSPGSPGKAPTSLRRPKTASGTLGRSKLCERAEPTRRPSTAGQRATPLTNCESLERRLRGQVYGCWREIQRRCREVDPERLGEIAVDQFTAITDDLQIRMTQLEREQLAAKYDTRNNGRFSYPDFLRHFVFTLRPQDKPQPLRLKFLLPQTPMSGGVLSVQCVDAMLRIQDPVQQFWRGMRQNFVTFDRNRSGSITLQDFRKVLRQYRVNLTEEELFHLCSFFDKDMSGKISYNHFLHTFLR